MGKFTANAPGEAPCLPPNIAQVFKIHNAIDDLYQKTLLRMQAKYRVVRALARINKTKQLREITCPIDTPQWPCG